MFSFLDKAEELEVPEIKTYLAKYRDFTDKIASMFKKLADDFTDDKVDEISTGKYFKNFDLLFRFYFILILFSYFFLQKLMPLKRLSLPSMTTLSAWPSISSMKTLRNSESPDEKIPTPIQVK